MSGVVSGMPRALVVTLAVALTATVLSAIGARDLATWAFELVLGGFALGVLAFTHGRQRFSNVAYGAAAVHFVVLAIGAHYTYGEVPAFDWLRETLDLSRNHFDRLGHFLQGFVPALFAREIFLARTNVRGVLLGIVVSSVCLAFSASYEILETLVVIVFYPNEGPEWLGMQGDPWDAQWDMTMALSGSVLAQLVFGRVQPPSSSARSEHAAVDEHA